MPQRIDVPGMGVVEFPDGMTDDQITAAIKQNMPEPSPGIVSGAKDFFRSIPGGMLGGLSSALSAGGQSAQAEMGQPIDVPSPQDTKQILQQNVTGELPTPQGRAGRFGNTVGEFLGNPGSYVGPGTMALKAGGAVLSGIGSEAGRQAAEGTGYEGPAALGGALLGGGLAAKRLGASTPKAATPTPQELKEAATLGTGSRFGGYKGAAQTGLELDPAGVAQWAAKVEQDLYGKQFSGGPNGTAPKTFSALGALQSPPAVAGGRAFIGPANIGALRTKLQDIAQEVQPVQGGAMVPTKDAAAASAALEHLAAYTEAVPQNHVMAGDAGAYANAMGEVNANYAAFGRGRDWDARTLKAERAADKQKAGNIEDQLKNRATQVIDRGAKGYNPAERAQLDLIERGGNGSNILRQIGRGGVGVLPLMTQAVAAAATGGAHLLPQAGLAAALYGAHKASQTITKSRADKLAEMLAQRSPLYEQRVANLPPPDYSPNVAALARALIGAQ